MIGKAFDFYQNNKDDFKQYAAIYERCKEINSETEKIRMQNEKDLKKMAYEFEIKRTLIERVFGERAFALRSQYEALHKGLETDNTNLVLAALKSISDTIAINPVEQLIAYKKAFDNPDETLYLDF